ncbi:MAG TPA: hypothetical protein VF116_23515 [Ktedonobacterales bacterium]
MEPIREHDFVHALMVKLNRVSIAAILVLVAIYGLVAYRGTTSTAAQGSGTGGAAHVTMTSLMGCGAGSYTTWPAPVRGPH